MRIAKPMAISLCRAWLLDREREVLFGGEGKVSEVAREKFELIGSLDDRLSEPSSALLTQPKLREQHRTASI